MAELLHADAHALSAFRLLSDEKGRKYTAATFPRDPWQGCERMVRTLRAIGGLTAQDGSYAILDVLNENGDIVQDFGLTRYGFRYLKRKLDLRVESDDADSVVTGSRDRTPAPSRPGKSVVGSPVQAGEGGTR